MRKAAGNQLFALATALAGHNQTENSWPVLWRVQHFAPSAKYQGRGAHRTAGLSLQLPEHAIHICFEMLWQSAKQPQGRGLRRIAQHTCMRALAPTTSSSATTRGCLTQLSSKPSTSAFSWRDRLKAGRHLSGSAQHTCRRALAPTTSSSAMTRGCLAQLCSAPSSPFQSAPT